MEGALESYGKFRAYFGVAVALLICSSSSWSGYYAINYDPKFANSTTGTAKNVKCSSNVCEADVTVVISGNTYTPHLMFNSGLVENSNVTVYYSNDIPPQFNTNTDNLPKGIGYGLIGIGLCILVVAMVVAYFVSTSPTVAKVYGGVGAVSDISQLLRV